MSRGALRADRVSPNGVLRPVSAGLQGRDRLPPYAGRPQSDVWVWEGLREEETRGRRYGADAQLLRILRDVRGWHSSACLTTNPGAAYGYPNKGGYQGAQAELLRVPFAVPTA